MCKNVSPGSQEIHSGIKQRMFELIKSRNNEKIEFKVWNGVEMVCDVMVGKFGIFYVNPANNGINVNDSACITPYNTKYPDDIPVMQYWTER